MSNLLDFLLDIQSKMLSRFSYVYYCFQVSLNNLSQIWPFNLKRQKDIFRAHQNCNILTSASTTYNFNAYNLFFSLFNVIKKLQKNFLKATTKKQDFNDYH